MKWELKTFDEIGFIGRGKSRHRPRNAEHLYGGEYPFVQTGDIKAANFRINEYSQTYNEAGLAQSKLWKEGTLCITIAANIADTAILGIDACFPDSVIGFVPYDDKSDVRFVKYFFDIFQARMKSIAVGAAQDNLSLEKLLTFKIPTPPLPTQRRIASILSAYDDLIENNLKRIKLLEEKAFLRYKQIVREEKFSQKAFSEVANYTNGYPFRPDDWKDEGLPIIKIKELKAGVQDDTPRNDGENIPEKYFIENKDILFAWSASIGAYLWCSGKSILNQHIFNVKPFDKNFHNWLYFSLIEKIPDFINLSNGATMQHIKKSAMGLVYLPVPPKKVYEEFQKETDPILNMVVNLYHQNTKLREARDILLPKLMNGQIEV
jgi:type I restriction enzyme S subunit